MMIDLSHEMNKDIMCELFRIDKILCEKKTNSPSGFSLSMAKRQYGGGGVSGK